MFGLQGWLSPSIAAILKVPMLESFTVRFGLNITCLILQSSSPENSLLIKSLSGIAPSLFHV